jgi:hypothetical protein
VPKLTKFGTTNNRWWIIFLGENSLQFLRPVSDYPDVNTEIVIPWCWGYREWVPERDLVHFFETWSYFIIIIIIVINRSCYFQKHYHSKEEIAGHCRKMYCPLLYLNPCGLDKIKLRTFPGSTDTYPNQVMLDSSCQEKQEII